ncbi:hypothetical protein EBR96_11245 [bacterium]|nr:hypothetical protein [bacterium]
MNIINPTLNTPLVSGVKRIYTNGSDLNISFSSNAKLYNPRVSVYSDVNEFPGSPRTTSIDGTSSLNISVGGDTGDQPVDVIFEDGMIQAKMMCMMGRNDPMFSMPMFSMWKNDLCVRNYRDSNGSWAGLCKLNFALVSNGDRNEDISFMDTPGGFISWGSTMGDSIEVNLHFTEGEEFVLDNKRVYFKFEFDCDGESNHTHTKWGILTLKKDPVTGMNITWSA